MGTEQRRIPVAERFVKIPDCLLGTGATKVVYKGYDKEEVIEVAWNEIQLLRLDSDTIKKLETEILLLRQLRHPSLIRSLASWLTPDNNTLIIITELMTSGTLHEYILDHHCHLKPSAMIAWSCQIISGLAYLHSRTPKVIHRDLKCDNLFINGQTGVVKIGDLGISRRLNDSDIKRKGALTVIGTPEFMAPECYDGVYDERCDIWSFGLCVIEMATGETPYSECQNGFKVYEKVKTRVLPEVYKKLENMALNGVNSPGTTEVERQEIKKGYKELFDIASSCLKFDPEERPSAAELLKRPVFASFLEEYPQYKVVPDIPKSGATNSSLLGLGNGTVIDSTTSNMNGSSSNNINSSTGTVNENNRTNNSSPNIRTTPSNSRSQSMLTMTKDIRDDIEGAKNDLKNKEIPQSSIVNSKKLVNIPLSTTSDLSLSSIRASADTQPKDVRRDDLDLDSLEIIEEGKGKEWKKDEVEMVNSDENDEKYKRQQQNGKRILREEEHSGMNNDDDADNDGHNNNNDNKEENDDENEQDEDEGDEEEGKERKGKRKQTNIINNRNKDRISQIRIQPISINEKRCKTADSRQSKSSSMEIRGDEIRRIKVKKRVSVEDNNDGNNGRMNSKESTITDDDNEEENNKPISDVANPFHNTKFKSVISPLINIKQGSLNKLLSSRSKSAKFKVMNDGNSFSIMADDTIQYSDNQGEGVEEDNGGMLFKESLKTSLDNENFSSCIISENEEDQLVNSTTGANIPNVTMKGKEPTSTSTDNINIITPTPIQTPTSNNNNNNPSTNNTDGSSIIVSDGSPNVVMLEGILEGVDEAHSVVTVRIDLHLDNGTLTTIHFPYDVGQDDAHDLAMEMIAEFEGALSVDPALVEQTITAVVNNATGEMYGDGDAGGEEEQGEMKMEEEDDDDDENVDDFTDTMIETQNNSRGARDQFD